MVELILDIVYKFRKLLISLTLILFIAYSYVSFQTGIYDFGTFLKYSRQNQVITYEGSNDFGDIKIMIDHKKDDFIAIDYILSHDNDLSYYVRSGIPDHISIPVEVYDQDMKLLFKGSYPHNSLYLTSESGSPYIEVGTPLSSYGLLVNGNNKPPYINIVSRALVKDHQLRGDLGGIFLALLLTLLFVIDVKYPLFFFYFKNRIWIHNPEPNDFYYKTQHATWLVYPFIIVLLLMASLK